MGAGLSLAMVATILLWRFPDKEVPATARVTPTVTTQGGGVTFEARF